MAVLCLSLLTEVGGVSSILQMGGLRHRKVKPGPQGHTSKQNTELGLTPEWVLMWTP